MNENFDGVYGTKTNSFSICIPQPDLEKIAELSHRDALPYDNFYSYRGVRFNKYTEILIKCETHTFLTTETMFGFKAFNSDMTCLHKHYEVGKTHEEPECPIPCTRGMHFCTSLLDVLHYYEFKADTRFCLVKAEGLTATYDHEKFCTNKLTIIRELTRKELLQLLQQDIIWVLHYCKEIPAQLESLISYGACNAMSIRLRSKNENQV